MNTTATHAENLNEDLRHQSACGELNETPHHPQPSPRHCERPQFPASGEIVYEIAGVVDGLEDGASVSERRKMIDTFLVLLKLMIICLCAYYLGFKAGQRRGSR